MMLAAGEGTRLRPHTLVLPKPAIPFLNVPLAAWSLAFLEDLEVQMMCVNTHHLPTKINDLFKKIPLPTKDIKFSDEQPKILGSGGGLSKVRDHFEGKGPFILMNSDEVILPEQSGILRQAFEFHQQSNAISTLIVTENEGVGSKFGGVWVNAKNKVVGFGKEKPAGAVKGWHFIGVQILSDEVFHYLPEDTESNILYDGLVAAIANGHQVRVFPIKCLWFETGNQADFLSATKHCLEILANNSNSFEAEYIRRILNKNCGQNWKFEKKESCLSLTDPSAIVSTEAILKGFAVIAANTKINGNSIIENAVVGENLILDSSAKIQNEIRLTVK